MTAPLPVRTNLNPLSAEPTGQELVRAIRELEARLRATQAQVITLTARVEALEP